MKTGKTTIDVSFKYIIDHDEQYEGIDDLSISTNDMDYAVVPVLLGVVQSLRIHIEEEEVRIFRKRENPFTLVKGGDK